MSGLTMMMRLARAIMRTDYPHLVLPSGALTEEGDVQWERRGHWYLDAAKSVLEELREPTAQMVNAGDAWLNHSSDSDGLWDEMVKAAMYPDDYSAEMPA